MPLPGFNHHPPHVHGKNESTDYNSRFTAFKTLLSKGFLLGSLVEERIPVPQLFANVLLKSNENHLINLTGTKGLLAKKTKKKIFIANHHVIWFKLVANLRYIAWL